MHAIPPLAPCNLQHRHAYMHEEVPTWSMVDTARQPPSHDMHVWQSPLAEVHRQGKQAGGTPARDSRGTWGPPVSFLLPCPPSLVVSLTPLSLLPHSLNRFYFGLRQDVEQEVPSLRGRDRQARFQAPVSPAGDPPTRRRQGKQARALRLLLSNGNSMPSGYNPYVHVPVVQASAAKLLKETCNYIRSLNRDVDDLSDRLSAIMATMDSSSAEAEMVRSLLRP
ncbi:hypothetical protein GW17_00011985 [Ensete ventricosum]|nr:hypothetical protein GW17_00011985 [Ensete ventricosum]